MSLQERLQETLFSLIWQLISKFPVTVIVTGVTLAVVSALMADFFLQLNTDQDQLVSPELPFQKKYLQHLKNFGDQEYLYVVIKTGGTKEGKEKAVEFAESLAHRFRDHPELIRSVHYRISSKDLGDGALLFASKQEIKTLTDTLSLLTPYLKTWFTSGKMSDLIRSIGELMRGGKSDPLELDPSLFGEALASLSRLFSHIEENLAGNGTDKPLFKPPRAGDHYFFSSNGRLLIMRILPQKDYNTMDVIGKPLTQIRQAIETTRLDIPGVEVGLTGRPVLQADEMNTTNRDMTRASVAAIILVGLLFMIIYHGWLRPVLILACLVMAMAWTFGFALISVGELNLLSIVFALVLVGIGVDFGVHIVMRYAEDRQSGLMADQAIKTSLFRTGPGIILGAVTSVCAFYSVLWSDFRGLAELGLIGGTGVLLSLVAMLIVLPSMLLLVGSKTSTPLMIKMAFMERLSARPGLFLLILASLTLMAIPGLFKIRFSYNLLELQAKGLESVEYEKILINASDDSTWYAILTGKSLEDVRGLKNKLEALPSVGKVMSILDFIPENQDQKLAMFKQAAATLNALPVMAAPPVPPDSESLIKALKQLASVLEGTQEKLFTAGAGGELALLDKILGSIYASLESLGMDGSRAARLAGLQNRLRNEISASVEQLKRWLNTKPFGPKDLPASLRDLYIGRDGRYQVKVTPSENVWDFDKLKLFVAELRKVEPSVSGVPVVVLESARLMHKTFISAAGVTLVLVSVILWLYSFSLRYVILTLLPLGAGLLWLLEGMGWLGLNFNLANFFAIPILIAIGVDGGVHFLARWKELDSAGELFFTSTPTAVALSFATTMIGFGGLLFAHHQGLASLGAVMVLGSLTGMLACILVLPAVLKMVRGC